MCKFLQGSKLKFQELTDEKRKLITWDCTWWFLLFCFCTIKYIYIFHILHIKMAWEMLRPPDLPTLDCYLWLNEYLHLDFQHCFSGDFSITGIRWCPLPAIEPARNGLQCKQGGRTDTDNGRAGWTPDHRAWHSPNIHKHFRLQHYIVLCRWCHQKKCSSESSHGIERLLCRFTYMEDCHIFSLLGHNELHMSCAKTR